ncbi:MAG: asparagine synthase (glutamine-hydrolyzing) [Leptospiraceae bacterium]|nr:asparagine synthase (glutamine-hydrolyzing) [Leptospiraceae bacterium]
MCGIAGFIYADKGRQIDKRLLENMAAIQYHRGPDDFGTIELQDEAVGMSHARLMIIDLSESGRQPYLSEDKNLLLAHNGEFYDYQRIRADLSTKGAKFRSKSDSEILMHLYPEKGFPGCLNSLRGEFSFALYDKKIDRLILVRDRFGIKPLYFAQHNGTLAFGSEIKSIFAHPDIPREFHPEGLLHQLMQTIVPGSTPFAHVQQVKPGHFVTIDREAGNFRISEKPYWDLLFPKAHERDDNVPESKSIESVRESLIDAVRVRLEADVPVGCYLSGGIDSCAITGLASSMRQDPVKAFTIGFDHDSYDESHIALEMAQMAGADQELLRLKADHLYDHFEQTHWHTERTIYNTLGVAKYLMSQRVHEIGYRVVLTGEGSDELFGGYPSFRKDMFEHSIDDDTESVAMRKELEEANRLVRGSMLPPEDLVDPALSSMCGFTPSSLQTWLATEQTARRILNREMADSIVNYSPGAGIASQINATAVKDRHPLDIAQYMWIKTQLEGQILTWGGDRVDMANSMEARPPFLDHILAEKAVHLPPKHRIKGQIEKYVLREAMKGVLPKTLYERRKFAFMAPPAHTDPAKLAALRNLADKYLADSSDLLNTQEFENLWQEYSADSTPAWRRTQLDAVINHSVGIMILGNQLIKRDVPSFAASEADRLGWRR